VCHLESRLRMRFAPRSSGQITSAFNLKFNPKQFLTSVYQTFQKFGPRQGRRRRKLNGYLFCNYSTLKKMPPAALPGANL